MTSDIPLQILGGIGAREFLRDYWQKKPLLIRQAILGFQSPISPDELAGLSSKRTSSPVWSSNTAKAPGSCAEAHSPRTPISSCRA